MANTKDSYAAWYAANKEKLSAGRKARYQSDPAYKAIAKARSADYRSRVRSEKPGLPGMTIAEVCTTLGISSWTLNKWRTLGYYPEPSRHGGHPVFQYSQVELLSLIRDFFRLYPKRASATKRDKLASIVEVVFHNWTS